MEEAQKMFVDEEPGIVMMTPEGIPSFFKRIFLSAFLKTRQARDLYDPLHYLIQEIRKASIEKEGIPTFVRGR